jgi:putative serine protease PepD
MKRLFLPILAAVLAGAIGASAIFLIAGSATGQRAPGAARVTGRTTSTGGVRRSVASTAPTATQIYQQDSSGVVSIKTVSEGGGDTGTGIVLNSEGLILTNNHVISDGLSITVSPGKSSNVSRPATVVGADANSDLALIKIDPSGLGLVPLKLVSSSSVQVGDSVYAIGNPYGLDETLTKGIVSALDREIGAPNGAPIKGAIQTDAALNPGNSGGPLLNAHGGVIGVNSQIASDASSAGGGQPGSTGVGFAISSNTVSEVIKTIEAGGGTTGSGQAGGEARAQQPSQEGEGAVESPPSGEEAQREAESPYGGVRGGEGEGAEVGPYGTEVGPPNEVEEGFH